MAIFTPGPIVQSISGRLASCIFHAGATSHVISISPSMADPRTSSQLAHRRALAIRAKTWLSMHPFNRQTWKSFARTQQWTNKLGIRRHPSGFSAYLAYWLKYDPLALSLNANAPPPARAALSTQTPIITSLSFTAGGPYNVTFANADIIDCFAFLYVERWKQYGPRAGAGSRIWLRYLVAYALALPTTNLLSTFVREGITLDAGEQFTIEMFWIRSSYWPSLSVRATGTVA